MGEGKVPLRTDGRNWTVL